MAEEEKYIREIWDIFLFLTQGEPTPDDEIEFRNKLIEKFKILKTMKRFQDISGFLDTIINKLENWDTLDLWFKEVEDLLRDIEKFIKITSTISEKEIKEEKLKKIAEIVEATGSPQIDIKKIVSEVSEQFRDEIKSLREKVEDLQKELGKRADPHEKVIAENPVQKAVIKKETKLVPPQIKIPLIKKSISSTPKKELTPIAERESSIDKIESKVAKIEITKIKEEKEVPKSPLTPEIKSTQPSHVPETPLKESPKTTQFLLAPKLTGIKPVVKTKAKSAVTEPFKVEKEENIPKSILNPPVKSNIPSDISEISLKKPQKIPELINLPKSASVKPGVNIEIKPEEIESIKVQEGKEMPKFALKPPITQKTPLKESEKSLTKPIIAEKPKIILDLIKKPLKKISSTETMEGVTIKKLEQLKESHLDEKPKIFTVITEETSIKRETPEKPKNVPFAAKGPPTQVSKVEEEKYSSKKSNAKELYNVFSSVGEKNEEKLISPVRFVEDEISKDKKKKLEKKKKGEIGSKQAQLPTPFGFSTSEADVSSESDLTTLSVEDLPKDKDALYQELIALEGKRYSLEKKLRELEELYVKKKVDDNEYTTRKNDLKNKHETITSNINGIRGILSNL